MSNDDYYNDDATDKDPLKDDSEIDLEVPTEEEPENEFESDESEW